MPGPPVRARGAHFSESRDECIREIMNLMIDGEWIAGRSHHEIAEKYGLSYETVKANAGNASRIIRFSAGGSEDIKTSILLGIDRGLRATREAELVQYNSELGDFVRTTWWDHRASVAYLRLMAEVHGFVGPTARMANAQNSTTDIPPDELRGLLEELAAKVGCELVKKGDDNGSSDGDESEERNPEESEAEG